MTSNTNNTPHNGTHVPMGRWQARAHPRGGIELAQVIDGRSTIAFLLAPGEARALVELISKAIAAAESNILVTDQMPPA